MTLSIVVPFYNEEARIDNAILSLLNWKPPKEVVLDRVIFVSDGSTDQSNIMIKRQKSKLERSLKTEVKIISYKVNRGKGFAIAAGMEHSNSDYTLFMDADMATPMSQLRKFLPFMKNRVDIIIGTRKNGKSTVITHQPRYREIMGKGFTYLSNILLNTWVTDFTCGFKAFSRVAKNEIFPILTSNRWGFDAESLFLATIKGFSIQEMAVRWSDRSGSKVNVLIDAPRSLFELISIRLKHLPLQAITTVQQVRKPALAFVGNIKTLVF